MPVEKNVKITLYEDTEAILDFTVKDAGGSVPSGVGSWAARFSMKENIGDTALVTDIACVIQNITTGVLRATIPGSDLSSPMINAIGELTIWTDGSAVGAPDVRILFDVDVHRNVRG